MKHALLTTSVLAGVLLLGSPMALQAADTSANTGASVTGTNGGSAKGNTRVDANVNAGVRTDSNSADVPGSAQERAATATGDIRRDANALTTSAANASQQSAASLVEHINLARMAIALKDKAEAQMHINEARKITSSFTGNVKSERVQAGRFTYEYNKDTEDYYYPIAGGMVERKDIATGPFWSDRKGIAVKNAEAAYVTLDINPDEITKHLNEAEQALNKDDFKEANDDLAALAKDAVNVENAQDLPLVKAQDNLALSRYFLRAKNYDGARYALKHAEDAIDKLDRDDAYNQYDRRISAMKSELKTLNATLEKRDPTALDKAEAKIGEWWTEMKQWTQEKL